MRRARSPRSRSALLDGFDVPGLDEADYVHVIVEATKLAFEDRDRYPSRIPRSSPFPSSAAARRGPSRSSPRGSHLA